MEHHGKQPATSQAKSPPAWRSLLATYGFAVAVSGLTLTARLSLDPWLGKQAVLVLFILPIIFSAYVGGLGPGLLATACCTLGSYHFLRTPEYILYFEGSVDLWQWAILLVVGVLISCLTEALRRSQKKAEITGQLHAITLASIGDGVITTDAHGCVTFLNGEAERLTGWTKAAAAGQPLPAVFHIVNQATRALVEDPVRKVFRTGMVVGLANHTVLIARDGREFVIDDSGAPIRQADGKIIGVVLVFRDNTAKKQAEDAVRESQALYHSLVDQMPAGIFRKNAEGRYDFVNAAFCQMKGRPPEYFLGKTALELGQEERNLAASRASHHAQIMQTGEPVEVEEEFFRADGQTLLFHVVKTPVFNADRKVVGSQGVLFDVTERRRAEKALRESEERFRTLVEQASDAIFVHDVDGRLLDVNQSACEKLGYTRQELLQLTVVDLEQDVRLEEAWEIWRKMQPGQARLLRGRHRRKDGTDFPVEVNVTCYELHGRTVLAALARDISFRLEYEEKMARSVSLLRATIESSASGILAVDTQGKIAAFNQRFLQMWNLPEAMAASAQDESLLNYARQQLTDPEAASRRVREIYTQPQTESFDTLEFKDGRIFERISHPQRLGEAIIGRVWSFLDVTERKRAEKAIQDRERLLRQVIDLVPHFIFAKDRQGRHLFVNRACAEANGLTTEQMVGRRDSDFVADLEQAEAYIRDDREVIEGGRTKFIPEERFLNRDGSSRIFETIKVAFMMPGTSDPALLGVAVDITERVRAQATVKHERHLLRSLIDLLPDFIFVKDMESRFLVVNESLARAYGQSPAGMLNHSDADFLAAPLAAGMRAGELRVMASTSIHTFEDTITLPDGQPRALVTSMVAFRDNEGKVGGLVGIGHDVTAQKIIEKSMRLQSVALEAAANSILITDHNGSIEWVNPAFTRSTGYTLAECLGKNPRELLHSKHHGKKFFQQLWETILAGRVWHGEIVNRRKDGSLLLEEMTITPLLDRENRTTHFIAIRQDITERKTVAQQLMHLAAIVESSEDAIISKTLDGVITSWNRGAEIIFGYPAIEMIGQPMLRLFPDDVKHEESEIMARIARGESVQHFETERVRKDGTHIRVSASISPLKDATGNVVGASTIARDTTRQHVLEEQLRQSQKMEAIGQLAGGVAHDFNNILAVIQMQTELSKIEGNFTREQLGCLEEIQVAANRAAKLTRQLLLFSRRQRLQPRELDLSDSISGMTKMLRRILGEDIQMQFKYAPQPLFILADAGMMDQVVMNLTLNSRDAMPAGGQLVIETAAVKFDRLAAAQITNARPGTFVRLSVSDTGCGIPPEILPRIFEPFFTTKDVGKGTGLGLATVFSIVQQHQGWISVASKPGQGTTFHIYLPQLAKISARLPAVESALVTASGGDETILLVEDDEALRASVRKSLAQLGYHLLEAANGAEALQVWHQHRDEVDLLLTDLVMPGGMSGKDLAGRLLQENPKLKVIYASGYSAEVAGKDFPLAEGVNFLSKPFPVQTLARTIRACLDRR